MVKGFIYFLVFIEGVIPHEGYSVPSNAKEQPDSILTLYYS